VILYANMKERGKEVETQGSVVVIQESELDEVLDKEIRYLLASCFEWTPEFQERSYWHLKPETRFVYKSNAGEIIGHASIVERSFLIDNEEIKIAGGSAYAVYTEFRNSGIGKELVQEVVKHTINQSYDLLVGFVKEPASRRICINSGAIPTRDVFVVTYPDGGEVLKSHTMVWPLSGEKYQMLLNSDRPIILGYGSW